MSNPQPTDHDDDRDSSNGEDDSEDSLLSLSETQDLCDISYSREATIAAFADYYHFLTAMYLDPKLVHNPPDRDGWPEITIENMRAFGKSDEVVELLRRLPYIRPASHVPVEAGGGFELTDWASIAQRLPLSAVTIEAILAETQGGNDHVPSHVVGLTQNRDAEMFLDTHLGLIYFPGASCTPGPTRVAQNQNIDGPLAPVRDNPVDYAPEEECIWRSAGTGLRCAWAIPKFFELLKFHFRELNYIPLNRMEVAEAFDRGTDREEAPNTEVVYPSLRNIFLKHGWPDLTRYRKDECMDEVERTTKGLD